MQSLKIILLCMVAVIVYGICHDQVTARVCVEYFTVGHTPIFSTESPTLLAFEFGVRATWWVGLILGVLAALACQAGSWPRLDAEPLIRPIACLLVVMTLASLLAGITGYQLAKSSGMVLPEPFGPRIPKDCHSLFFADSLAHLAAYSIGLLGGLALCLRVLVERSRMARAAPLTKDGSAEVDLLGENWVVVISRWTARTIAVPLFGLLVLLVEHDGVPNPLTASLRENLLGTVVLMMLCSLILAWKWEGLGGLLILGGLVLFATSVEAFLLKIVITPWLAMGSLYLVSWMGKHRLGARRSRSEW